MASHQAILLREFQYSILILDDNSMGYVPREGFVQVASMILGRRVDPRYCTRLSTTIQYIVRYSPSVTMDDFIEKLSVIPGCESVSLKLITIYTNKLQLPRKIHKTSSSVSSYLVKS
jgi:hypothetical protein